MDQIDYNRILETLEKIHAPPSKREAVKGDGCCLGLTFTKDGPRISLPKSKEEEFLIHIINEVIDACDTLRDLLATSLQVNKNRASSFHRDSNNMGISAITTLGDFVGGRFQREGLPPEDLRGRWLITDGRELHGSEAFSGTR